MNAKKVAVALSALVLGLASCGEGNNSGLARKQAEEKLDAIVAATPAAQNKLTASNTNTDPKATISTYVFDGEANYSHIKFEASKAWVKDGEEKVKEVFAYAEGENYVFGLALEGEAAGYKFTVAKADVAEMEGLAQAQIDAFVKCGREHWHNGAGGLSAYLKRQDKIEQNLTPIKVGDQTIEAGATEKGSYIRLADEKYSSTGEGNLTLDFDALYPNPEHPEKLHEPLLFEFNNNILTHWYNKKGNSYKGNEWTMNYGTANAAVTTFAEKDLGDGKVATAKKVVEIIKGVVAIDQPYDEANLYPAKWGK